MQVCSSTLKLKVWLAPPKFLSTKSVIDPVARFSSVAGAATESAARDMVKMVEVKCMIVDFWVVEKVGKDWLVEVMIGCVIEVLMSDDTEWQLLSLLYFNLVHNIFHLIIRPPHVQEVLHPRMISVFLRSYRPPQPPTHLIFSLILQRFCTFPRNAHFGSCTGQSGCCAWVPFLSFVK
jgi:hypothetical protein